MKVTTNRTPSSYLTTFQVNPQVLEPTLVNKFKCEDFMQKVLKGQMNDETGFSSDM
jgi:hypothetical protein